MTAQERVQKLRQIRGLPVPQIPQEGETVLPMKEDEAPPVQMTANLPGASTQSVNPRVAALMAVRNRGLDVPAPTTDGGGLPLAADLRGIEDPISTGALDSLPQPNPRVAKLLEFRARQGQPAGPPSTMGAPAERPSSVIGSEAEEAQRLETQTADYLNPQPSKDPWWMQMIQGASEGLVFGEDLPARRQLDAQNARQLQNDRVARLQEIRQGERQRQQDQLAVEQQQEGAIDRQQQRDVRNLQMQKIEQDMQPQPEQPKFREITRSDGSKQIVREAEGLVTAPPEAPTARDIDPLSEEGIQARLRFERGMAAIENKDGGATAEDVNALANMVMADPSLLTSMTPTMAGPILVTIAKSGRKLNSRMSQQQLAQIVDNITSGASFGGRINPQTYETLRQLYSAIGVQIPPMPGAIPGTTPRPTNPSTGASTSPARDVPPATPPPAAPPVPGRPGPGQAEFTAPQPGQQYNIGSAVLAEDGQLWRFEGYDEDGDPIGTPIGRGGQ